MYYLAAISLQVPKTAHYERKARIISILHLECKLLYGIGNIV